MSKSFSARFQPLKRVNQDPLRDRFERVPYIQHNRGDSWGLLGFDKKLEEEDIQFVKDNSKIEGKTINWSIPQGPSIHDVRFSFLPLC